VVEQKFEGSNKNTHAGDFKTWTLQIANHARCLDL